MWYWCIQNVFCCVYVCVFITASLAGVFRKNRLQMLLRIQKQSYSLRLCSCTCMCVFVSERESESEWLTPDVRVRPRGIGRGHVASLAGHYQCVTQRRDGYFLWDKTHTQLLPESLRNAYPSQSIGRSIGDQLAIPCNQFAPCCMATEVPQWLWHLIKLLIAVLSFLRYPP